MGEFGKRLKMAMERKKMTAPELAEAVGMGKSTVTHYLAGLRLPSGYALREICLVLQVSADWLLGIKAEEE